VIVGGTVAAGGGFEACVAGVASNESGQLGIACAGVAGSSISDGGGQAGMARSVGGSGGQMSVSSGGAGEEAAAGGHVDFIASEATAFGGSVSRAGVGGSVEGGSIESDSVTRGSVEPTASLTEASAGGGSVSSTTAASFSSSSTSSSFWVPS
jgi:hypothetical protein